MRNRVITLISLILGLVMLASVALAAGQSDLAEARQATAKFHKVTHAETAGYASTLETLGCFDNPDLGGMGLHYVNGTLLDGFVDPAAPEALVYEMRDNGKLKLVALEYIVPGPPEMAAPDLFGQEFHHLPSLNLWVLHAWIWKPNPSGMFADWNPRVGACPD